MMSRRCVYAVQPNGAAWDVYVVEGEPCTTVPEVSSHTWIITTGRRFDPRNPDTYVIPPDRPPPTPRKPKQQQHVVRRRMVAAAARQQAAAARRADLLQPLWIQRLAAASGNLITKQRKIVDAMVVCRKLRFFKFNDLAQIRYIQRCERGIVFCFKGKYGLYSTYEDMVHALTARTLSSYT